MLPKKRLSMLTSENGSKQVKNLSKMPKILTELFTYVNSYSFLAPNTFLLIGLSKHLFFYWMMANEYNITYFNLLTYLEVEFASKVFYIFQQGWQWTLLVFTSLIDVFILILILVLLMNISTYIQYSYLILG